MGAADFRLNGRIFATLAYVARGQATLMLTAEQQSAFLADLADYTEPAPAGDENGLVLDPRFRPFLRRHLTATQSFWGTDNKAEPPSLASVAADFLAVPGDAAREGNRYLVAHDLDPDVHP